MFIILFLEILIKISWIAIEVLINKILDFFKIIFFKPLGVDPNKKLVYF